LPLVDQQGLLPGLECGIRVDEDQPAIRTDIEPEGVPGAASCRGRLPARPRTYNEHGGEIAEELVQHRIHQAIDVARRWHHPRHYRSGPPSNTLLDQPQTLFWTTGIPDRSLLRDPDAARSALAASPIDRGAAAGEVPVLGVETTVADLIG
jgi:hypothetical protein